MIDADTMLVIGGCYRCSGPVAQCPECVVTVRIDPLDGLPLDVQIIDGRAVPREVTPEAQARSTQALLCDDCVGFRNANASKPMMTGAARHALHRRGL